MSPETTEVEATETETLPPPRPRSGRAMASLEQWEQRGKGPSGPTVVSLAFSAGIIALGVLLVKNGVLAPPALTDSNDPVLKRGWAPFFDVSAVGAATAQEAAAETEKPPAPTAAAERTESQKVDPGPKEQSDPYAHLEEAAGPAQAPAAPTVPQMQSAPRVLSEKNTSVTDAPSPVPNNGTTVGGGKSTWGGERSPVEGR